MASNLLSNIKLNVGASSFTLNTGSASFVPSGASAAPAPAAAAAAPATAAAAPAAAQTYVPPASQAYPALAGQAAATYPAAQAAYPAGGAAGYPGYVGGAVVAPVAPIVSPEIQYLRDYYDYAMANSDYFMNLIQFHDTEKIALNSFLSQYGNTTEGYGTYYKWLYDKQEAEPMYASYLTMMEEGDDLWGDDDTLVKNEGKKKKGKKGAGGGESDMTAYMKDLEIYKANAKKNKKKNPDKKPPPPPSSKPKPAKPPPPKPKEIVSLHQDKNIVDVDETREPVSIVFIGHVDVGKSTICGNIMYVTGKVDSREIHKYEAEAKDKGRDSWWLAYCMDVNEEERERGKTVQVGRATFVTKKKRWTIFDAPGHKNYVPNMIMGASNADVAALVVSARINEFESGFEKGGQTQEHAMLARSLGVSKLVVIVNKMDDESVEWQEARFNEIQESLIPFLTKDIGYTLDNIHWVPISGLRGQNIKDPVSAQVCAWYKGPCLFELLDMLPLPNRNPDGPVRIPVLDKMKDRGYMVFGKVESGTVRMGDTLYLMPEYLQTKVVNIYNSDEECVRYAKVGENVKLRLAGVQKDEDLHKGQVLSVLKNPVPTAEMMEAEVQLLELPTDIISEGFSCMLHIHTYAEDCTVVSLLGTYFTDEEGKRTLKKKKVAASGQTIRCRIQGRVPMAIEKHETLERLGTFILRDQGKTIGIGKVLKYKPLREVAASEEKKKEEEDVKKPAGAEAIKAKGEAVEMADTGDQAAGGTPAAGAGGEDGASA